MTGVQTCALPIYSSEGFPVTLTVDDLAKYVNDAVEKRIASMQSPKTPEASETAGNEKPSDELAKQYAELLAKTQNLEASQEKAYKKQLNNIIADLKALGIEHPEKMAPEALGTEQRISILESVKENFAKNSSITAPLQEPLSGGQSGRKPNQITVDDVLGHFDEVFGSGDSAGSIRNDAQLRHMIGRLSDPALMRKYNMNVLFDSNGNYIGPM